MLRALLIMLCRLPYQRFQDSQAVHLLRRLLVGALLALTPLRM